MLNKNDVIINERMIKMEDKVLVRYYNKNDKRSDVNLYDDKVIVHFGGSNNVPIEWKMMYNDIYMELNGNVKYIDPLNRSIHNDFIEVLTRFMKEDSIMVNEETKEEVPYKEFLGVLMRHFADVVTSRVVAKLY